MTVALAEIAYDAHPDRAAEVEEARVDLEYHALMGVRGGDEPAHVRAFDCDVFGRRPHRSRSQNGEQARDHTPTL